MVYAFLKNRMRKKGALWKDSPCLVQAQSSSATMTDASGYCFNLEDTYPIIREQTPERMYPMHVDMLHA